MDINNIKMDDIKVFLKKFINVENIKSLSVYISLTIATIIIYNLFFHFMVNPKKITYEQMQVNKIEVDENLFLIKEIKKDIKKLKPIYLNQSALFHDKNEVEELYRGLSKSANENGLVITSLAKNEIIPIYELVVKDDKNNKKKKAKSNNKEIFYYIIPLQYEIKGNFLGYIKFKKSISSSSKIINFEKETITLEKDDTNGRIVANGQLTVVGLPNEFF